MYDSKQILTEKAEEINNIDSIIPLENFFSGDIKQSLLVQNDTDVSDMYSFGKTPDWYFFILIAILIIIAWIKVVYSKFLNDFIISSFNYQLSHKVFNEAGIVRKRVGYALNGIYLISGGLFLYIISDYYNIIPLEFSGVEIFFFFTGILLVLIIFRIVLTRLISVIFEREVLFSEFIHHFYLYNKLLGLILLPFLLFIPYTEGLLQEILVIISLTFVGVVYFTRLIRIIIFIFKNVIFLFYLFLYLCVLEIMPLLVIIRLVLSLK